MSTSPREKNNTRKTWRAHHHRTTGPPLLPSPFLQCRKEPHALIQSQPSIHHPTPLTAPLTSSRPPPTTPLLSPLHSSSLRQTKPPKTLAPPAAAAAAQPPSSSGAMNIKGGGRVPVPPAGAGTLVKLVVLGGTAVYAAVNSLYNVEGGHRAIVFNRIQGIKDKVTGHAHPPAPSLFHFVTWMCRVVWLRR